ncbi:hypothetical protein [Simiduia aestuariiviva]|uniref:Uncharacterized protein n=1 Tax=Simiduia aestuariiviva TaxID=1510459 RepID=A0A839UVP7_9GAMM|nr:hypothetical protein [Simiduia aestuariiviva]MBB3169437.1 hypothetical protein [Simiduia aestuariiviva]
MFALMVAAALWSAGVFSQEVLHSYPSSGIDVVKTDRMFAVEATGQKLKFDILDRDVLATAFVHRDGRNPYTMLEAFSEQFFARIYSSVQGYSVISRNEVQSEYANGVASGQEYVIEFSDGKCELYLASALGKNTYVFFNISDEINKSAGCEGASAKLRKAANDVMSSISVDG